MERGRIAGGDDSIDGGVPTPGARRARLATASAAVLAAAAVAADAVAAGSGERGLVALGAAAGVLLVLAALLATWDTGLVAGSALLLLAYAVSLASRETPVDWRAPFVAAGLLAVVELGSWSLELGDGAEERPLRRLPALLLLLAAALAASGIVLAAGAARPDAGLVLWALGAAAAMGVLALIADVSRAPETDRRADRAPGSTESP